MFTLCTWRIERLVAARLPRRLVPRGAKSSAEKLPDVLGCSARDLTRAAVALQGFSKIYNLGGIIQASQAFDFYGSGRSSPHVLAAICRAQALY